MFNIDVTLKSNVSENNGTPKSSILIGFSIINHPCGVPLFLETPISGKKRVMYTEQLVYGSLIEYGHDRLVKKNER